MATANVPNNAPNPLPPIASTARTLFVGLLWGAIMLVVFGLWMRSKYEGKAPVVTPIFLAAGLVAAALALWQGFTLWFAKETPDQKLATLTNQQRLLSYLFLAGGLGLIVMAFVVGIGKKDSGSYGFLLGNFAETLGCLLFGLITLASGYVLQLPRTESVSPMQFLVAKAPMLKLGMAVIGACSLIAFAYLGFVAKIGFEWFPELAALVFMSMLCMSCFFLLNTPSIDEFGVRFFVLTFGGFTGLILFFLSIGQSYLWRQDIFLGGISAWQGANAWHFWLCAYAFFVSLVLMAVSFNLARADIRSSVMLRRVMYGYDAIVQTLLVLGILMVLNVVVYAMVPFTYDWTQGRGIYDLSPSTKNLISGLKKEITIVALLRQGSDIYREVRNLTDNMQALNNNLKVRFVSPDLDPLQYGKLIRNFPEIQPDPRMGGGARGILVISGPIPEEVKEGQAVLHAFIPERRLTDSDRTQVVQKGGKAKTFFKGESEIYKELKFILQDRQKRKIYFLQGDDEPNFADDRGFRGRTDFRMGFKQVGMGIFADKLRKDNYDVLGLTFQPEFVDPKNPNPNPNLIHVKPEGPNGIKEIPKDCKSLIVAGVSQTLSSETIGAIDRYMAGGGKMMVFLDVIANENFTKLKDSGLAPLLKRYGVEVTDQFALSVIKQDPDREEAYNLAAEAPLDSNNPLPKAFADKYFFLNLSARILKPVDPVGRYKAESIMELYPADKTQARSMNFSEVEVLANPQSTMWKLRTGNQQLFMSRLNMKPAIVGLAVTDTVGDKPCLIVFGDTEFITNRDMVPQLGKSATENYLMASGALDWLAEREFTGNVPPRESSSYSVILSDQQESRMIWLPGWLMLLSIIGLGTGIWITRRR